jgi:CheY-like chemotaxis protein
MPHPAILIVDDDADDRLIFHDCFEDGGIHDVGFFENSSSILQYLGKIKNRNDLPRLIISDLNMPGITGMQLLTTIKQNPEYRSIDVVILSTTDKAEYIQECLRLGARACFQKPYTYTELKNLRDRFTEMAAVKA